MLFNSYVFIFAFLPVVWIGYFRIGKHSHSLACLWLAAASLFFYGWWDVRYVSLLLGSIVFNYGAGVLIGRNAARQSVSQSVENSGDRGHLRQPNFSDLFQIRQLFC